MASKSEAIAFLNSEIMRNQVYHNHKESMAWVATVFYISGVFATGTQIGDINGWFKPFVIGVAIVITGLAFSFVCWQFGNRRTAAHRVRKLILTAQELCTNNENLEWYFKAIKEHKDDPDKTKWISSGIMGIALLTFLMLVCC